VDFDDPNALEYQYFLEGFDADWWVWTKESKKEYTNLHAGDYVFKVRSKNVYGTVVEGGNCVFEILPPWHQTLWAYLMYLALGFSGVWGFVRLRLKQLETKNRLLEEKVADRTKELSTTLQNLQETQSQLIAAEKMASIGQLVTNVAHEINTPIGAIRSSAQTMQSIFPTLIEEFPKVFIQLQHTEKELFIELLVWMEA